MRPAPGHQPAGGGVAGITTVRGARALDLASLIRFNERVNRGVVLWVRSEWRHRWGTMTLLAVLVAIGGGAAVGSAAAARRTDTAFSRMTQFTREPNLEITSFDSGGMADLDPALLDRVIQIDGVQGAIGLAFVAVAPEEYPNYFALAIVGVRGEPPRLIPVEGIDSSDQLVAMAPDEVLLNEAMRDQLNKATGDTVRVGSLTPDQFIGSIAGADAIEPGGPTLTARIVGVSRDIESVSDAPDPFLLFGPAFYATYGASIGGCRCIVRIHADPDSVDAVAIQLAKIYPDAAISKPEDFSLRIADTVALQRRTWWLIAFAAAIAGVVTLFQACSRMTRSLMSADAANTSTGMTLLERRIGRFLVLAPAVVVGTVLSAGVSYALSPLSPVGLTKRAEPHPGFRWDPAVVLPGIVVVLVLSLGVVLASVVVQRGTRDSHSGAGVVGGGGIGSVGGPVLSFGSRLAFGPGRGALFGVALCSAGLVGALTLEHSIHHVLSTPSLFGADFDAGNLLYDGSDKRADGATLANDPDIEAVALVWDGTTAGDSAVHVVGPTGSVDLGPKAFESLKGTIDVRPTQGRVPGRPDEVAVGRAVLVELGAHVGDRVTAAGSRGTVELTIVGDNLDPGVDVAGGGFAMTLDGLVKLVDPALAGVVVRFGAGVDHAGVIDRYPELHLDPVRPPSEVGNIGQLGGVPLRAGQLFTILGVAATLNAGVQTVRLSRRQIAIHRALGFTSGQVVAVYLWQGLITAVAGAFLGGGIGFVVGRAILLDLVGNVGAVAQAIFPSTAWLVVVGIALGCVGVGTVTGLAALQHRPGSGLRAE